MPNMDLGTAEGKIVIDASGVDRGVDQANQSLGRLGKSSGNTAAAMQSVGAGMLGVGGAAVAGFAIAVKSAADFESQISGIEAVSQGTEDQMEAVRKKALQLGADTKFSAGEAAGAIEELSRRGINLDDILGGAADAAVNLAAATGTDIATAATIASNAMNVFGLSAEDLGKVTDQIAGFDVVGSSVEDFGLALTQSGAVADLVGVSFEDLTTTIAAMSKAGINSSDAGTSIKQFLNNLQPTTEKQIGLAKELGIIGGENNKIANHYNEVLKSQQQILSGLTPGSEEFNKQQEAIARSQAIIAQATTEGTNLFYDEAGSLKSMQDVAGVLSQALDGLTDQQRQQALETLFGSDAIRAAAVVAEQGADGFGELAAQIGDVSAQEQAETRMDNLSGSIEQLKGSIETYLIQGGSPFLDSVRQIVDMITQLVNFFGQLPAPVQKMIGMFVLFGGLLTATAGAGLLVTGTFIKFAQNLATIGKAVGGLGQAMKLLNLTFLANPVVLVVLALIALGVALVIAYKKSEKFRNFVNGLGEDIQKIWGAIVDFFKRLPEIFSGIWDDIKGIWGQVAGFFEGIADQVVGAWDAVVTFFKDLPGQIGGALGDAAGQVKDALGRALDEVVGFVTKLPGILIKGLTTALKEYVKFYLKLPERAAYFLGLVIGRWIKFHIELVKLVIKLGTEIVKAVVDFMKKLPGIVLGFLSTVKDLFVAALVDIYEDNVAFWSNLVRFILSKLGEFLTWLPGFLVSVKNQFISWGQQLISWAIGTFSSLVSTIVSWVSQLPGKIGSFFATVISNLPGYASSIFSKAVDIGKSLVNGLVSGVGDLVKLVKDMVMNAINGIGNLGQTAYNKMKSVGESMWSGFKKGLFGSPHTKVEYAVWEMTDNVEASIKMLGGQVRAIQNLSRTLPGVAQNEPLSASVGVMALSPGSGASVAPQANPGGGFTWVQQGPLVANATIRNDNDIKKLARELRNEAELSARARGEKVNA